MIFSQLEIKINYMWVGFANFLVYTVVALRLGSVFYEVTEMALTLTWRIARPR
jgi:hypothetical protein